MKQIVKKPILSVDQSRLSEMGIRVEEFSSYFPRYLCEIPALGCGSLRYAWLKFMQWLLKLSVKIFLHPRKGLVENLDIHEVERVYNREAATYDIKHHLTTHGMDTTWRRLASWSVATIGRNNSGSVAVLDLCTGTGLTIREMAPLLSDWGISGSIIGLDYNSKMLDIARSRNGNYRGIEVSFVRGDAMNLARNEQPSVGGMERFGSDSFDAVTQMFGIGGISNPLLVFQGVLQILKPGGQFFLIDMHQPIAIQPGEWPFLLKWFQFPRLEAVTYNQTTMPLVLNRLWGWRDPTMDFYLLPLVTFQDKDDKRWGFKVVNFEVESQRWWLGLPLMPVGKIIVEKTKIGEEEYKRRQKILSLVT